MTMRYKIKCTACGRIEYGKTEFIPSSGSLIDVAPKDWTIISAVKYIVDQKHNDDWHLCPMCSDKFFFRMKKEFTAEGQTPQQEEG